MPVSHIGLTVSHLPTSTSFFASALQPLGYRYIGESGNQIGFGIYEADFFLCQETPGLKAGAAHIAFTASSPTAVRNFYTAALTAGGRPNGSPATRCAENGQFNAAVLDFDGNSIEVVYRNGLNMRDDGTVIQHSRVMTYTRTVTHSFSCDGRSVVNASASQAAPSVTSQAESVASKAPSVARSVSAPTVVPQAAPATTSDNGGGAATHLLGALLGAAAGAAVTYAFVRSERDSAKKEADFSAFMDAKNAVKTAAGYFAQATSQPQQPQQDPQPAQPAPPSPPQSVHRDIDTQSCYSRASQIPTSSAPRQIEAAPASYYSPSSYEPPRTQIAQPRAIEYAPAYSVAPSRAPTRPSAAHRSLTSPEMLMIEQARSTVSTAKPERLMIEKARSTVSTAKPESVASASTSKPPKPSKPQSVVSEYKARSVAPSAAPSSFVSSFVPDLVEKRSSAGSEYSHHSSRSKAKSSHTSHTERERNHRSRKERESSPSPSKAPPKPPTKAPSKAASVISSILGRNKKNDDEDFIDDLDIEELTEDDFDLDTVVPSDSISQIGSHPRRKHRSHRSKKHDDDAETSVSKSTHRSSKKHDDAESSVSKSSKHSHRSERSHRSHRSPKVDSADDEDSSRPKRSSRKPSVVSDASEASTARPVKEKSKSSRKDSLTQGQSEYDHLFDDAVQYGAGNVAVRGITPSMVSAARRNPVRSMTTHGHAQKMRNFEGSQAGMMRSFE